MSATVSISGISSDIDLIHFSGEDYLGHGFFYQAHFISSEANLQATLGKPIAIAIDYHGEIRTFQGLLSEWVIQKSEDAGFHQYSAHIVPWMEQLGLSKNYEAFQQKTPVQIIQEICLRFGIRSIDITGLKKTYQPLNYYVQWNEHTHHFLYRVLADFGIDHYFKGVDGDLKWMLTDSSMGYIRGSETALFHAKQVASIMPTQVTHSQHHSMQSAKPLQATSQHSSNAGAPTTAHHVHTIPQPSLDQANQTSRLHLKRLQQHQVTLTAHSHEPMLQAGMSIPVDDEQWLITEVSHSFQTDGENDTYSNRFKAIHLMTGHVPAFRKTPQALGVYPAVVHASAGNKLQADDYNRIQVLFPWQQNKEPAPAIRKLEASAGNDFGSQHIPRAGDTAWVQYLLGNPNHPVIVGAMPTEKSLPFALPDQEHESGFAAKPIGKNTPGTHALLFSDEASQENVHLQSGKINYTVEGGSAVVAGQAQAVGVNKDFSASTQEKHQLFANQALQLQTKAGQIKANMTQTEVQVSAVGVE